MDVTGVFLSETLRSIHEDFIPAFPLGFVVSFEQAVQIAVIPISLAAMFLSIYTFWWLHRRGSKLELLSEKVEVQTSANVVTLRGLCIYNDGTAPGVVEDIDIYLESKGQTRKMDFDTLTSTETVYQDNQWKLADREIPLPLVISPSAHIVINVTAHYTEAYHLPIESLTVLLRRKGEVIARLST